MNPDSHNRTAQASAEPDAIVFGENRLRIEDIVAIAEQQRPVAICDDPNFVGKINRGVAFLEQLLREDGCIYGVTTGYGDSCTVHVPPHLVEELPLHLTRFHGCGLGQYLSPALTRSVLATRLCSLSQGVSGVSMELLERLATLLNHNICPQIPEEGSVGASGDLTPLSYVAAALIGERDAHYREQLRPMSEIDAELGLKPIRLRPKEGLAVMNGTAVMTAIACIAYKRAEYLAKLVTRISAMASSALLGNAFHFDERLFAVKPHQGQAQIAAWMLSDLEHSEMPRNSSRLQDRYSLRCAPHVIGVLQDTLPFLRGLIENELNSANDNPIIDGEQEHVMHGGHFYGGHIALAMDTLKNCIANLADLLDRQMALLMDIKFNNGLPPNLSGSSPERAMINHGFKAVQIGCSAWTAEALKLTMPASVFSRSTECHNQDKVSMGTIAARDCLRVLQLTEQVAAAALMASSQGLRLRQQQQLDAFTISPSLKAMQSQLEPIFPLVDEDRPLEAELRQMIERIQQRHWSLYE